MSLKIKKLVPFLAISVLLSVGIGTVYAQTSTATTEESSLHHYAYVALSFLASGIFYSASGWIQRVRRKLAGENVALDYSKMGKSVLIGVILGVGAFAYSTYQGDTISIHTPQEFLVQVGINTTAILFISKWILGRTDRIESNTPVQNLDDFDDDDDDIETTPPGKGISP